jgi:hypothetical protein
MKYKGAQEGYDDRQAIEKIDSSIRRVENQEWKSSVL